MKEELRNSFRSVLVLCAVHVSCAEGALLDGKQLLVGRLHGSSPIDLTAIVTANATVGPGVELSNFGVDEFTGLAGFVDVDISDAQILLTLTMNQEFAGFENLEFQDTSGNIPPITNVLLNPATQWTGMTRFRISFSSDTISVNVGQLSGLQGQQILLDVVPEPASASLALVACLAAVAVRRRYA